jgi:polar amino acid transport system substrate-binding protein
MHRFLLAALALVLTTGCPPAGPDGGSDAFDQAKARGKLIVGLDAGYIPFESVATDGSYEGYDIDLIEQLAKDLELELEIKNVTWDGIIPALKTGKIDLICSGMSVTEDRQRAVAFSAPYYHVGQVVVKRKGDTRFAKWQDLNQDGIRIATQQGTTGEFAAEREVPKAEIVRFDKVDEACLAVIQEKADAVVFDHPYLVKYVADHPDQLDGLWEPFTSEAIAMAIRKDSPKLVEAVDAMLTRLESSGELAKIQAKWFPEPGAASQESSGEAE